MIAGLFGRLAAAAVRRPALCLALAAALAIAGGVLALRLETAAGTDTLVDDDRAVVQETERFKRRFGDDAVVVLVRGELTKTMLTADLVKLVALEGCMSGNVPPNAQPVPGPCEEIAQLRPAKVVFGPGTFVNQAAAETTAELASRQQQLQRESRRASQAARRAARREGLPPAVQEQRARGAAEAVQERFVQQLLEASVRYGLGPSTRPSLDSPEFVSRLVFDSRQPVGTPKARFAYLFPTREAALISVRLRPGLSDADRDRTIELYAEALGQREHRLRNGSYVLSGVPAVISGLAGALSEALILLLAVGFAVMGITLAAAFRARGRLVPLGVGLGAAGITFGALELTGGRLTMASVAVLPVLIGLAVDYAIQLQARFSEALDEGAEPEEAARLATARGGPVIALAAAATLAGFIALIASPVPMVREFGLLVVVGIAVALPLALTAGFAAVTLTIRRGARPPGRPAPRLLRPLQASAARLGPTMRRWAAAAGAGFRSALATAIARPARIVAIAAVLAVTGWAATTQTEVVSDIRELVPGDLGAIEDVDALQDATGVSGELNVSVRATGKRDLARPEVIRWMSGFRERVLERYGFEGDFPRCDQAEVCPSVALTDLFRNPAGRQTTRRVRALLDAVPPYFSQAVITRDRRSANVSFGIRVGPLDRQKEIIDGIRGEIERSKPPEGVSASLAGLPVIAAEANADLADSRYWLVLAGIVAVALVLGLALRDARRVGVVLLPVLFATGWSGLVLAGMDVPLNPMSATLGALVIAITTEFAVLLSSRFRQEREGGLPVGAALRRTYERTGAAVLASALTTLAGFAVLIVSDIQMLRDFGFATVVDLTVALLGVMLVLPAALVLADARANRAGAEDPVRPGAPSPAPATAER